MSWEDLLDEFATAVNSKDTLKLGIYLINIQKKTDLQIGRELIATVNRVLYDDIHKQIFLLSLDYMFANQSDDNEKKIKCQIEMVNLLSKKLLNDPAFYLTPIIIIAKNLRILVFQHCPVDSTDEDKENPLVASFTNCIQKPFKQLISNKSDTKINISAIHIFSSHLFSIYFRYNKFNAVINLYKVLNTFLNSSSFDTPILPTSSLFNYFLGKALILQSNYSKSFDHFLLAYSEKHSKHLHHKILVYLLPLQYILKGKKPTDKFFKIHPSLAILKPLFNAVKKLDLKDLEHQIESLKHILLHLKLYAIYIQFYSQVELEIVRLTHKINSEINPEKNHIVPFSTFSVALGVPVDESEALLCRLIALDKIKGYLSHANQVIVLSKTKPF